MLRTQRKMGDILLEAGVITGEQLREALLDQQTSKKRLGRILIEKGYAIEEKVMDVLEEQLGIFQINLNSYDIDPEVATSIPLSLARRYQAIPVGKKGNRILLAMSDPMDLMAIDDIGMVTGAEINPVIASERAIIGAINQFFGIKESMESTFAENITGTEEVERLKALEENAPIVKVVNSLIQRAVNEGASDIHIEPSEKGVRIRMRVDGKLHDLMTPPRDTQPLIVSRIKIMSHLDITERRMPQDGSINMKVNMKDVNLRVSTIPTIHGEKVVIRILDKSRVVFPLEKLGLSKHNFEIFKDFLMKPAGMILITGPTGCGKTTTLYSALNFLNRSEENIITVEDPVEYHLEGINQVQVNPRIGMGFAESLRAILRQDPNIIMVGEIRDPETAEIATRAALTGHLVLSTMHTNSAAQAVSRLTDMGVAPYLISSSLVGVVAQRLVRLNCPRCKQELPITSEENILIRKKFERVPPRTLYRGAGCSGCNNTGYRGRAAIHELMVCNQEIRKLILEDAPADYIQQKAVQKGAITLLEDGFGHIERGNTTLEELLRVAYDSSAFTGKLAPFSLDTVPAS